MKIDLKAPKNWGEVTAEQMRDIARIMNGGLNREECLLALLCKFSGIKIVVSGNASHGKWNARTRFRDSQGIEFELEAWQVSDFCKRLCFVLEEKPPINAAWPFRWDKCLMDTAFGDWFHADALLIRFIQTSDVDNIKKAMKYLGDGRDNIEDNDPDILLTMMWYYRFKEWIQDRYPLVFLKSEKRSEAAPSPVEARRNIMLMLNDGRPQDNEAIEKSNMHDVLAALQHKIEEDKHIEEQMNKYKK